MHVNYLVLEVSIGEYPLIDECIACRSMKQAVETAVELAVKRAGKSAKRSIRYWIETEGRYVKKWKWMVTITQVERL